MRRLRVTAKLMVPVAEVEGQAIHLDGLLAEAWRRREREQGRDRFHLPHEHKLPLLRLCLEGRDGHVWFWAASQALWPADSTRSRTAFVKRADSYDVDQYIKSYSDRSGPTRNYLVRVTTRVSQSLSWLCFGHKDGVEDLLGHVKHLGRSRISVIGKHRAKGFGLIAGWEVEEEPGEPMDTILDNGCANRNLPASIAIPGYYAPGPWRPPYNNRFLDAPCVTAGDGFIIDEETLQALRVQFTHENGIRRQRNRRRRGGVKHRAKREARLARIARGTADG